MDTRTATNNISTALFVKMATDAWYQQLDRTEKFVDGLTDEQLAAETAPGRNTGVYLYGHLIAVNDRLFDALGFGGRLHPELDVPFLTSPDKSGHEFPSAAQLRQYWQDVRVKLDGHMAAMQPSEWFEKHSTVSAEDFEKEPNRNKLNVLMSRTNHLANHLGQLAYLAAKK